MKKTEINFHVLEDAARRVNSIDSCREFCQMINAITEWHNITKQIADQLVRILDMADVNFPEMLAKDKEEIEMAILLVREKVLNAAGFTDIRRVIRSVSYIELFTHNLNPKRVRDMLDPLFRKSGESRRARA